ncbi:mitochondrial ribosomal protein S5 [Arctopsyche grandis]|uniref:mitochondrial ribosomal protein S5 n=1 Tax=Arctopsyche grandis TaxID=121162 RepID=UPI00406D864B
MYASAVLRLVRPAAPIWGSCCRLLTPPVSAAPALALYDKHFSQPNLNLVRPVSFFNKLPAEHIWKGVTSVSNAGAKKGRGRGAGRKKVKDLNKGQVIGLGRANMVWPGLSAPVIQGNELVRQQKLPPDPDRHANILKMRDSVIGFRFLKLSSLERGWSGTKMPGRKLGPPDPIGENVFEGFETKCLEFKSLLTMRGPLGRVRRVSAMVVTGNNQGLAGFSVGKSRDGVAALRKARNRAGQKLMYFNLFNGHTVYHDFFTQFGKSKIFVTKKPEGHGLKCHRVIKTICEVLGIKDLHCKVEGSTNTQHLTKAFFIGLLKQKTHQQLAEEKKLHLVEFRKEKEYFPKVVGSPSVVREKTDSNEVLNFTQYVLDNRVVLKRKKYPPFYTKLPHWVISLKKFEKRRNHEKIRMDLLIERGELKSFLNDKYPKVEKVAD